MLPVLALLAVTVFPPRQIIDLDRDWQFARLPTRPSIWKEPGSVPTASWKVLSVSSEETTGENGRAVNAFDGDPHTIWHTEWSKKIAPYPHQIIVDLGSTVEATGVRLLPRQSGPENGHPNHFELYLSNDSQKWGAPVTSGQAPDNSALYEKPFPAAKGRYLRLVFRDGYQKEPFLALSEIGLIRKMDLKEQKAWASQYNIESIEVSDRRFNPTPADLESLKKREVASLHASNWETVCLPHSAWIRPLGKTQIWQGVAYYRREWVVPSGSQDKRFELTLEAGMQSSDLWLNGVHLGERRGGYLPLVVDLSGRLKKKNELLVRVDNRDNPLIPPGKPQQDLDFMYGNGLYRNAYLTMTGPVHITDPILENKPASGGVYVTFPEVAKSRAVVRIRTHVRNEEGRPVSFTLRETLLDEQGAPTAISESSVSLPASSARQFAADLRIKSPRLWSPDHPNLYRVATEIVYRGKVFDRQSTTVGIRKIEVSRSKGFLINGNPLRLVGTNRHQDYPWVGPALSDAANQRDAVLIRQAGHNIVRLSHYPQSPTFLDECDRVGLMTIPCIPGWQFINRDPLFAARVRQDIRELIRRDRNHPCAAFWEPSLNETYPPAEIADDWYRTAKSESLDGRVLAAGDGTKGAPWDIVYNQWVDEDMSRPQNAIPNKPGYVREYGDYEFGGASSTSRVRIGAGIDKLLQETWNHTWSLNKLRPQYPWTMGVGTWEMFDSNVPWEYQISACGLADIMRRPKPSFWFYKSQTSRKPIVKIAATWQPGLPTRNIVAFTNCDQAVLFVNGVRVQTARPDRGAYSEYAKTKPFDGSNTANLDHAPCVFRNVRFRAGSIKVVGLNGGASVASDLIRTHSKSVKLKVWVDDLGIAPTRNDLVFVRAALVDASGTVGTTESGLLRFTVSGAGSRIGDAQVATEMGIASNLIRTNSEGRIRIRVEGKGLLPASTDFLVR